MSRSRSVELSIVIPVGPGDASWGTLVHRLAGSSPARVEILISAAEPPPPDFGGADPPGSGPAVRWIVGPAGRAAQLNRGAAEARGRFLWFLHADSRFPVGALPIVTLLERLESQPGTLWYFDLRFLRDGPSLIALNEFGARLRSRLFGLPFGDQGFALSHARLSDLGGFREDVTYGEDHLLVWAARHAGVPVRSTGCPVYTSARTYRRQGWLGTTLRHCWLTWRQAVPEGVRWVRSRGAPR
jgi:hypothetical protein